MPDREASIAAENPAAASREGDRLGFITCPLCGCACGLNLLGHRSTPGQPLVVTVLPSSVHGWGASGLCMRGWQMGEIIGSRRRLRQPMVWTGEEQEGASWEEALGRTGEALRRLRDDDPASIGIVLGDGLSNEEAFAARRLADLIGTPNVASLGVELDAAAIHGLEHVLGGPYRAPAPEELDGADLFLCVSSNFQHINPRAAGAMARRLQGGARMVLIDEVDQGLGVWAAHYARHRPGARAHALRQLAAALSSGEVPAGPLHADDVHKAVDEIESSRRLVVVLSAEAVTTTDEGEALGRLAQSLRAEMRWVGVYVLPSGANTFGTLDMLASVGPPEGMAALEMISPGSGLRGLVTIGEHLGRLLGPPDLAKLRERLEVAVSLASFASPATELADVALPVQMTGERGGTIRRPDGRLWWSQPVLKPAGKSRTITSVLDSLAAALGEDSRWDDLEGLWAQMRSAAAGYGHVSLADLQAGELPAVGMDAPRVGDVVGVGVLQDPPVAVREPTEDRPFLLIPRSTRGGWTTDPRCQAAHILRREATLFQEPYVLVAPQDLEELAVRDGGRVQVTTASGAAEVRARADSGTPPKLAVLPTEFPGLVRTLAGPGGRRAEDGRLPANPVAGSIRPADRR